MFLQKKDCIKQENGNTPRNAHPHYSNPNSQKQAVKKSLTTKMKKNRIKIRKKTLKIETKKEHKFELRKPTQRLFFTRFYALDFILFSVLFFTAPRRSQSFLFLE